MSLPHELIQEILGHLEDHVPTLLTCSLLCHDWREVIKPLIFREACFADGRATRTPEDFHHHLVEFPHLAQHFKSVEILIYAPEDRHSPDTDVFHNPILPAIFDLFPPTTELILGSQSIGLFERVTGFSWIELPPTLCSSLLNILQSPSLTFLELVSCWDIPFDVLQASPNLRTLNLSSIELQPHGDKFAQPAPEENLISLRKLRLSLSSRVMTDVLDFLSKPGCRISLRNLESLALRSNDYPVMKRCFSSLPGQSDQDSQLALKTLIVAYNSYNDFDLLVLDLGNAPQLENITWSTVSGYSFGKTLLEGLLQTVKTVIPSNKIRTVTIEVDSLSSPYQPNDAETQIWLELDMVISEWEHIERMDVCFAVYQTDGPLLNQAKADVFSAPLPRLSARNLVAYPDDVTPWFY